jgi:hypothetical protein
MKKLMLVLAGLAFTMGVMAQEVRGDRPGANARVRPENPDVPRTRRSGRQTPRLPELLPAQVGGLCRGAETDGSPPGCARRDRLAVFLAPEPLVGSKVPGSAHLC